MQRITFSPSSLPWLGAGIGHRVELVPQYERIPFGFLEVMPEHLTDPEAPAWHGLRGTDTHSVTHSVSLSIGSADGPDLRAADHMETVSAALGSAWCSDHLAFTRIGNRNIGQLTPIPYTQETLDLVSHHISQVQSRLNRPFLVENISQYFHYPTQELDEPDFLTELVRRTGCGLLLDLTNLHNNAHNVGARPQEYLDRLPLDAVVQLHLAGCQRVDGKLLDTHGGPVPEAVWQLTEEVLEHAPVRATLIERDQDFDAAQVRSEVQRASHLMETVR